jgi:hypothetical protein
LSQSGVATNKNKVPSMQKIYYKFLHQEKGPRMFMKKRIFKQPILNRQICNTKIEISKKKKNQTKKDLKK